MKNVVLLLILLLSSCSTIKYSEYGYSLDYSQYTAEGFFITEATSVNFAYTPIGSCVGASKSGYEKGEPIPYTKTLKNGGEIYNPDFGKGRYKYIPASYQSALYQIVNESKKIGADGIIGLRFVTDVKEGQVSMISAYGMAIKR